MRKLTAILLLFLATELLAQGNTETINSSSMNPFLPFVGTWFAPDSIVAKNPLMVGRAIFKFEIDKNQSHLKIYEDISLTDHEDFAFLGLLSKNPLTGMFEFQGINTQRGFFFRGQFKTVSEEGFIKEYNVTYPANSEMVKNFGQVVYFKEEFTKVGDHVMAFNILYYNKNSRKWEAWSDKEFVVIRKKG